MIHQANTMSEPRPNRLLTRTAQNRAISYRATTVREWSWRAFLPLLFCTAISAQQTVELVPVVSKAVQRQVKLPGEFLPYMSVPIHAKVSGFVKTVTVDKGSMVRASEVLATLEAPEMQAQVAEAESKAQAVELQR